jgi:hypothetical protein
LKWREFLLLYAIDLRDRERAQRSLLPYILTAIGRTLPLNLRKKENKSMNRAISRTILVSVFASTLVVGAVPRAQARNNHECSNASLQGSYGGYSWGTTVPAGTPRVSLVRSTFDGKGHNFTTLTVNDNGTVTRTESSGSYTVEADCTGTISPSFGGTREIVVVDGGKEYDVITTDPATQVVYGVFKKLFPEDDEEN